MLKRVLRLTIKRRAPVVACPRRTSFLLCGKGGEASPKRLPALPVCRRVVA